MKVLAGTLIFPMKVLAGPIIFLMKVLAGILVTDDGGGARHHIADAGVGAPLVTDEGPDEGPDWGPHIADHFSVMKCDQRAAFHAASFEKCQNTNENSMLSSPSAAIPYFLKHGVFAFSPCFWHFLRSAV